MFERFVRGHPGADRTNADEPAFSRIFGTDVAPLQRKIGAYLDGLKGDTAD